MAETTTRSAGTIYDLGYQHYQGERLGRANAVRTLTGYSFRAAFGRGRGEKAVIIPLIMILLAFGPAFIQITLAAAMKQPTLIRFEQQFQAVGILLALFVAAQAPELVSTDRQHRVLPLYLSRAIHATDYAFAKLIAFFGALMILTAGPELAMWVAKILLDPSPKQGFLDNWHSLAPIVGGSVVASLYLASIGLTLASFAARRAFGSAAVIAFFLLMPAASGITGEILKGDARRWSLLGNPFVSIVGFSNWLFDIQAKRRTAVGAANLPGEAYLYMMAGTAIVAMTIFVLRYHKAGSDT